MRGFAGRLKTKAGALSPPSITFSTSNTIFSRTLDSRCLGLCRVRPRFREPGASLSARTFRSINVRDFVNKTAFITGGASGIGFGMARTFLDAGMAVAIADIREDKLAEAGDRLGAANRVLTVPLDVSNRAQMMAAAQR